MAGAAPSNNAIQEGIEPGKYSSEVSSTDEMEKKEALSSESNEVIATPLPEVIAEASTTNARAPFNPGWKFYCLFGVLSVCTLVAALEANIVAVALPIISHDLNGTALESFWVGTSFLLTSCVLQPAIFSLSNVFGRKPVFMTIMVLFSVGIIIAAVAKNMTVLLLGRSFQGIGGGGILALVNVIVTDIVPLRERGKWFGFMAATWAIASTTGPVIGGVLAEKVHWRWIFWVLIFPAGLGIITLPFFLHLEKIPGTLLFKLKQIDWIGAILLTASVTSFLMPTSWGGVMFPWSSWRTLLPLILGIAGLIAFIFYEAYFAAKPLVALRIFKSRTTAVNYIGTTVHGIILWCMLYYLPLYYEGVKGYSATMTGVAIFPETFSVAPVAIVVGILVSVTGRYRWAIWTGWTVYSTGLGLLCLLEPETSIPAFVFLNLVPGIGAGFLFGGPEYAIQAAVAEKDSGLAITMFAFARTLGQSIGVAIGGVIFQTRLKVELGKLPAFKDRAVELSRNASALVQVIKGMDGGSEDRIALVQAYAKSLRVVWAVLCGLAVLAGVASLWTEGLSIDRELGSEQAFIHDEKEKVKGDGVVVEN